MLRPFHVKEHESIVQITVVITLCVNDDFVVVKKGGISLTSSALSNNPPCVSTTTQASVMCKLLLLPVLSALVYRLLANQSVVKATDQFTTSVYASQGVHGGVLPDYAITRPTHVQMDKITRGSSRINGSKISSDFTSSLTHNDDFNSLSVIFYVDPLLRMFIPCLFCLLLLKAYN